MMKYILITLLLIGWIAGAAWGIWKGEIKAKIFAGLSLVPLIAFGYEYFF